MLVFINVVLCGIGVVVLVECCCLLVVVCIYLFGILEL